jgi:hypothetical protein
VSAVASIAYVMGVRLDPAPGSKPAPHWHGHGRP